MEGFDIGSYLRISLSDMVLVLISTLLLVTVARHFFWDKLHAYLNQRAQLMQEEMTAARECHLQAEQLQERCVRQLQQAEDEARQIIQRAQRRGEQLIVDAQEESRRIQRQAMDRVKVIQAHEEKALEQAVIDLAAAMCARLTEKQGDQALHARDVEKWLKEAGERPWQA